MKIAGVLEDAIRHNLFSFSWLVKQKDGFIHSFKGNKFLKKFFPESKTVERKAEISSFHQFPDESLSEALGKT